ncbi:MAG: hypothetical protein ACJ71T_01365 [Actinomycetales bacterium]
MATADDRPELEQRLNVMWAWTAMACFAIALLTMFGVLFGGLRIGYAIGTWIGLVLVWLIGRGGALCGSCVIDERDPCPSLRNSARHGSG